MSRIPTGPPIGLTPPSKTPPPMDQGDQDTFLYHAYEYARKKGHAPFTARELAAYVDVPLMVTCEALELLRKRGLVKRQVDTMLYSLTEDGKRYASTQRD